MEKVLDQNPSKFFYVSAAGPLFAQSSGFNGSIEYLYDPG